MHRDDNKDQDADAILRLLTDGNDTTALKHLLMVFKIVLTGEAKDVKYDD